MKKLLTLILLIPCLLFVISGCKPKLKTKYRLEITSTQQFTDATVSIYTEHTYKDWESFTNQNLNPFVLEYNESKKDTWTKVKVLYHGAPTMQVLSVHFKVYKDGELIKDVVGQTLEY